MISARACGGIKVKFSKPSKVTQVVWAFDLGFSDMYPKESVRHTTFKTRFAELLQVKDVVSCQSILNFALFNKLPTHHPSVELWLETETDLLSSIYLALGGYYRQAIACLRGWLEITCAGVYYGKHWKGKDSRYNQWKKGRKLSPVWRNLLDSLFQRQNFREADKMIGLRKKMETINHSLCMFVHNRGMDVYRLQDGRDNVPRFLKDSFDIWFNHLKETFNVISLVLFAAYGRELRTLTKEDYKKVISQLSSTSQNDVKKLVGQLKT